MVDSSVSTQRATTPREESAPGESPLARILDLYASDRRRVIAVALAAALFAHAGIAGAIHFRGEELTAVADAPRDASQEVSIEREVPPPPPPPEPEPDPPPPPPRKVAENVIAPAPASDEPTNEPPASEAAEAAEVLTQEEEPDDEEQKEDDNTIVTGKADSFAGGMTAGSGTSKTAVHGTVMQSGGVPGGRGTPVAPPKPAARDLSRPAWLEGDTSWDCQFPGEADRDHVDNALVEMSVVVAPDGRPRSVSILDDPGHGFSRMATACALQHWFTPALDKEGRPIWARTRPFHVGFHR